MFVQTENTPNPNSLKFLPGKKVSNNGSFEITNKEDINNELVRNLLSINGVEGIFLGEDFISVNKKQIVNWEEIKHIVISLINDYYSTGKEFVIDKDLNEKVSNLPEIEQNIIKILDQIMHFPPKQTLRFPSQFLLQLELGLMRLEFHPF